ncbi:MAG TPA: DUF4239 domain-containing protein [Thermoanaerobaculia bacterium]|nr:DUF4239 domain-containing protein [Thermoanaerobaculia bacterium]
MKITDTLAAVAAVTLPLLAGMLACIELGWRSGKRRLARGADGPHSGLGVVESSAFALFGLLIAFTFSGAASRFDARRQLIAEETNAVGTAYLRLDLLSAESQPGLRDLFRRYLDTRLAAYRKMPDVAAAMEELSRANRLQQEIWAAAMAAIGSPRAHPDSARLLLPAINAMIDVTTTRLMAARMHPPLVVYALLLALALLCSFLAGHAMAGSRERSWLHILSFAAITVITIYTILEIEYPRIGLIRLDPYDQVMVELRAGMK